MKVVVAIILALGLWYFFVHEKDRWLAFVYPNKDDLSTHEASGPYGSLEQCRDASLAVIDARSLQTQATYECGLNCKPWGSDGGFPMMCEVTSR